MYLRVVGAYSCVLIYICSQDIGNIQGKIGESRENHGQRPVEAARPDDGGSGPDLVDQDSGRPAIRYRGQDGRQFENRSLSDRMVGSFLLDT